LNTRNLKLLSIYYSVNKELRDNLAAPLGVALYPNLNMDNQDNIYLAETVQPFLKPSISAEKLETVFDEVFTNIDSGQTIPDEYLGKEFSVLKTIDQFETHDSFIQLYENFIASIIQTEASIKKGVINQISIDSIKLNLNSFETLQLNSLFYGESRRAPLTLKLEKLRDIIDSLYESTCDLAGPTITDKFLSKAVKHSQQMVPSFNASTFL